MLFRLAFLGVVIGMALSCMPLSAQALPWDTEPSAPDLSDAEANEVDEIETDRDSFTPATSTAGFGETIFEVAHSFIDNRQVPDTHSFPELLIRHGANDWLELRFGWNYEVGGAGNPVSGNVPSDFDVEPELERSSRLLYGMKLWFSRQEGWLPQSAIILHGYTPTTGELTHSDFSASYVFGWTLPNRWTWDSAMRYSTGQFEEDDFNVWAPSTVIKIPVGERWKTHVEYFGVFTHDRQDESVQHFFSTGAHYLITSNLEIGCRVGWGLNRDAPDFFSNAGLGWRY